MDPTLTETLSSRFQFRTRTAERRARRLMAAMLAISAAVGLLGSFLLLHLGLDHPAVRWGLGVAVAWVALVIQLRLWARREARLAAAADAARPREPAAALARTRRRVDAAGAALDVGGEALEALPAVLSHDGADTGAASGSGGRASAVDLLPDDAEALPLLALVAVALAVLSALGASFYLVWSAPQLLSDLAFETAMAAVICRRFRRRAEPGDGWRLVFARTAWPAVLVIALFAGAGGLVAWAFPGARSLPEAVRALREHRWRGSLPPEGPPAEPRGR